MWRDPREALTGLPEIGFDNAKSRRAASGVPVGAFGWRYRCSSSVCAGMGRRRNSRASLSVSRNARCPQDAAMTRSEEHTSELQSLMRISYSVFFLKKQNPPTPKKENNYKK